MPETKTQQQDLFSGVNKPKDMDSMTDLEKKHLPVINAPDSVKAGECFEVTVEVGKLLDHPNENAHFIGKIVLYAGDLYLTTVDLTPKRTCPVLKACLSFDKHIGPVRAFAWCNMHGTWEATKDVQVK